MLDSLHCIVFSRKRDGTVELFRKHGITDKKLFEQAIFILRNDAVEQGVTDEMLLKEAQQAIRSPVGRKKRNIAMYGAFWGALGAAVTGIAWLVSSLL